MHGAMASWIEDGDMIHNPHWCLKGSMLLLLHNEGARVDVMLIEQLVTFMIHDSRVVDRLG